MKPLAECLHEITDEDVVEYVRLPRSVFPENDLFCVTASGEGMSGLGINDGDRLFFAAKQEPKPGDVIAVWTGEQGLIARQLFVDNQKEKYVLRAVGNEPRENILTDAPDVYGVLVYMLKKFNGHQSE